MPAWQQQQAVTGSQDQQQLQIVISSSGSQ
jgi:hypothetical protein